MIVITIKIESNKTNNHDIKWYTKSTIKMSFTLLLFQIIKEAHFIFESYYT